MVVYPQFTMIVSLSGRIVIIIIAVFFASTIKSFLFRTCILALSLPFFCCFILLFSINLLICGCVYTLHTNVNFCSFLFRIRCFIIDHMMSMILPATTITIQKCIRTVTTILYTHIKK